MKCNNNTKVHSLWSQQVSEWGGADPRLEVQFILLQLEKWLQKSEELTGWDEVCECVGLDVGWLKRHQTRLPYSCPFQKTHGTKGFIQATKPQYASEVGLAQKFKEQNFRQCSKWSPLEHLMLILGWKQPMIMENLCENKPNSESMPYLIWSEQNWQKKIVCSMLYSWVLACLIIHLTNMVCPLKCVERCFVLFCSKIKITT